eukprot:4306723-Amphidinium_carterae.1
MSVGSASGSRMDRAEAGTMPGLMSLLRFWKGIAVTIIYIVLPSFTWYFHSPAVLRRFHDDTAQNSSSEARRALARMTLED